MKEIYKNLAIPFASAICGGLIVFTTIKLSPTVRQTLNMDLKSGHYDQQVQNAINETQDSLQNPLNDFFRESFFSQNDPFEEMKKIRKQMKKRMDRLYGQNRTNESASDSWLSNGLGDVNIDEVSKREDDNFVYFDVKVDDVKSTTLDTKVENGYVSIKGTTEKKTDSEEQNSHFSSHNIFKSSFDRTFPLPENIDQNKMQMLTEKDKFVLKFPKLKV